MIIAPRFLPQISPQDGSFSPRATSALVRLASQFCICARWGIAAAVCLGGLSVLDAAGPRVPAYSEQEMKALQAEAVPPLELQTKEQNGLRFSLVNGKAVNALDPGNITNMDLEMIRSIAPVFRAMGFNAVAIGYRDDPKASNVRVTPEHIAAAIRIFKENGLAIIMRNHDEEFAARLWPQMGIDPELLARYEKGRIYRTWGNILSEDFASAQRAIFQKELEHLNREGSLLAFQPNDEFSGPIVPVVSGSEEQGKFQKFAKRVFGDISPGEDSNGDGTTYNAHFGTNFPAWEDVVAPEIGRGVFGHHYRDIPVKVAQFHKMFIADVWSRHISRLGELVGEQKGLVTYNYGQSANNWLSLLAAAEHSSAVDPIMYDPHFNFSYYAGAGWLFGKPSLASWVNTFKGDYQQTRFLGVRNLPYTPRLVWWHMTIGTPAEEAGAWGSDYNLADQSEFDGLPIQWPGPVNRLVKIDPRMKAIGEVAPFIGRFSAKPRMEQRGVLWVSPETSFPIDDYWVSEEVLSMHADRIPWDRLKLVIYSGSGLDQKIYETLRKFVASGGTVLVDAARLAKAPDYLGRTNDHWRFGGELVDVAIPTSDKFFYSDSFNSFYQWHGDRKNATAAMKWPAVEETGGMLWMMAGDQKNRTGSFEYEFSIPPEIGALLIEDAPIAWTQGSVTRLDYRWGGAGWRTVYQFATPDTGGDNKLLLKLPDVPGQPRDLRLRYTFTDIRSPVKNEYSNDPRNVGVRGVRFSGVETGKIEQAERVMDAERMQIELGEVRLGLRRQYDMLVASGTSAWTNPRGSIRNGTEVHPAFVDVPEGKGRWILALSGAVFAESEDRTARKAMLSAIAAEAGVPLLDAADPYILQSEDQGAVLAYRDGGGKADPKFADTEVRAECRLASPVVFDVFNKKPVSFRRENDTRIAWNADLSGAMSDAIWVIKDGTDPVLLCADGSAKYGLRVDDGKFADGKLTFHCAENAYVASRTAPISVSSPAGKVRFSHDAKSGILSITGPGALAEVTVEFPQNPESPES